MAVYCSRQTGSLISLAVSVKDFFFSFFLNEIKTFLKHPQIKTPHYMYSGTSIQRTLWDQQAFCPLYRD